MLFRSADIEAITANILEIDTCIVAIPIHSQAIAADIPAMTWNSGSNNAERRKA